MQSDGIGWRLWYVDYFDMDSGASLEAEGIGLTAGLKLLWRHVLEEGVLDDGRPTFTWFELEYDGGWARIPRNPLMNPELGRLFVWRGTEGLVSSLAAAHHDRLESAGAEWILAAARESENCDAFFERIV